jgi:hypothetical protein
MEIVVAAFVLVALFALWVVARNATTICVLDVRMGKVTTKRGGIAPRVLSDIRDVVRRPKVGRATVRITRSRGHAAVAIRGSLTREQEQQIRNVVGTVPLAKLVRAR